MKHFNSPSLIRYFFNIVKNVQIIEKYLHQKSSSYYLVKLNLRSVKLNLILYQIYNILIFFISVKKNFQLAILFSANHRDVLKYRKHEQCHTKNSVHHRRGSFFGGTIGQTFSRVAAVGRVYCLFRNVSASATTAATTTTTVSAKRRTRVRGPREWRFR